MDIFLNCYFQHAALNFSFNYLVQITVGDDHYFRGTSLGDTDVHSPAYFNPVEFINLPYFFGNVSVPFYRRT